MNRRKKIIDQLHLGRGAEGTKIERLFRDQSAGRKAALAILQVAGEEYAPRAGPQHVGRPAHFAIQQRGAGCLDRSRKVALESKRVACKIKDRSAGPEP